jgi:ribosomal protein S12 methylthiotransferase accessory factor
MVSRVPRRLGPGSESLNGAEGQLESLLELVSPRTGILKSLNFRVKSADQPTPPFIYDGDLAHFDFRKGEPMERGSCGKGVTDDQAKLGAIGEAIERYCASHPALKDTKRSTIGKLTEEGVPPPEFVLFSESQYKRKDFAFLRWRPEDDILWIRASVVGSADPVWVPASFAYLGQASDEPQDILCPRTSSGFAAGPDVDQALRAAILEWMERDAFMITWLNGLQVPEIEYASVGGVVGNIRSTYAGWGVEIKVYALATDMPVWPILAVALDRTGEGPAAVVGLGCDMDPLEALRKALFEICQLYELVRKRHQAGAATRLNSYSDVRTLDEHAGYFFRADHLHELDFLLSRGRTLRLESLISHKTASVDGDIQVLQRSLSESGSRLFFRDLTTPDLVPYPIRVVRAMITQLQPIHFGHGLQRLGGTRLYRLPAALGYRDAPTVEASLNECPHPLA